MVTTFSDSQYDLIMQPILQQGLSKAGIIHTFPCTLAYAPLQYGRLDIPNLYTEQLVEHMGVLLHYGDTMTDMTRLLI